MTDRLGKSVDQEIQETVAALRVYHFPTTGSCAGHVDSGLPYPWIDIKIREPKNWKEDVGKQKEWTAQNLQKQKQMVTLLAEFYADRKTPFDARLILDYFGTFGAFRLQSIGSTLTPVLSRDEQGEKLHLYRKEMNEFASFLRERYFRRT